MIVIDGYKRLNVFLKPSYESPALSPDLAKLDVFDNIKNTLLC